MRYRLIIRLLLSALLVAGGSQLAGCGQKGALYLPDEPQDVEENRE
ncbi:MAG: lipoprotein [Gammaproteobacteria bacterium]|jgi:predicted small lipoprotein YifL